MWGRIDRDQYRASTPQFSADIKRPVPGQENLSAKEKLLAQVRKNLEAIGLFKFNPDGIFVPETFADNEETAEFLRENGLSTSIPVVIVNLTERSRKGKIEISTVLTEEEKPKASPRRSLLGFPLSDSGDYNTSFFGFGSERTDEAAKSKVRKIQLHLGDIFPNSPDLAVTLPATVKGRDGKSVFGYGSGSLTNLMLGRDGGKENVLMIAVADIGLTQIFTHIDPLHLSQKWRKYITKDGHLTENERKPEKTIAQGEEDYELTIDERYFRSLLITSPGLRFGMVRKKCQEDFSFNDDRRKNVPEDSRLASIFGRDVIISETQDGIRFSVDIPTTKALDFMKLNQVPQVIKSQVNGQIQEKKVGSDSFKESDFRRIFDESSHGADNLIIDVSHDGKITAGLEYFDGVEKKQDPRKWLVKDDVFVHFLFSLTHPDSARTEDYQPVTIFDRKSVRPAEKNGRREHLLSTSNNVRGVELALEKTRRNSATTFDFLTTPLPETKHQPGPKSKFERIAQKKKQKAKRKSQ